MDKERKNTIVSQMSHLKKNNSIFCNQEKNQLLQTERIQRGTMAQIDPWRTVILFK